MGFIKNRYLDLTDHKLPNGTRVVEFVRTDAAGPIWKLRCSCGEPFFLPHSRIAPALQSHAPVFCSKCVLPTAKHETLSDLRKEEREQQRQTEVAAQRERDNAAQEAANEAAIREEKKRWIRFANAQLRGNVDLNSPDFMTFERWQKQSPHWRQEVLQKIGG